MRKIDKKLIFATQKNDVAGVRIALKKGANVDANCGEALFWAVEKDYDKILKLLLENKTTFFLDEALIRGCQCRSLKSVKLLLKHGANPKTNNGEPLRWAASSGCIKIVKLLFKYGANISISKAMNCASIYGCNDIVEFFLKNGADVNADNGAALRCAAILGQNFETVKLLLKHGAIPKDAETRNKLAEMGIEVFGL